MFKKFWLNHVAKIVKNVDCWSDNYYIMFEFDVLSINNDEGFKSC